MATTDSTSTEVAPNRGKFKPWHTPFEKNMQHLTMCQMVQFITVAELHQNRLAETSVQM